MALLVKFLKSGTPELRKTIPWEMSFATWINVTHKLCCIPVKFHKKLGKLFVSTNLIVYYVSLLRLCLLTLDNVHLLTQTYFVKLSTVDAEELFNFYMHSLSRIAANSMALACASQLEDTVYLFNVLFKTPVVWQNEERFGKWSSAFVGPVCKQLNMIVQCSLIFVTFQWFMPLGLYFKNIHSRRFWPSIYLPQNVYNSWTGILFTAINELHLSMVAIYATGYAATLGVGLFGQMTYYTGSIVTKLNELSHETFQPKKYLNTPLFQYRALQVLNRIGTECFCNTVMPCIMASSCVVPIIGLTTLIRFNKQLPLQIIINLTIGVLCIIWCVVYVYRKAGEKTLIQSVQFKDLISSRKQGLYVTKYIKGCSDLRMYVGSFFYVKESSFPGFIAFIIDQVITILFSV